MALNKQFYKIDFGNGLNTKANPKILSAGQLIQADNVRFQNNNTISKRYGFTR